MIRVLALFAALICAAPALAQPLPASLDKANAIVIDTSKGRIVIALRADLAPGHAARIKQLARDGFYNNVPFHRVIDGFMAQTGDGEKFNGTGGSKYPMLKQEFSSTPFKRGVVGMARREVGTHLDGDGALGGFEDQGIFGISHACLSGLGGLFFVQSLSVSGRPATAPASASLNGNGVQRCNASMTAIRYARRSLSEAPSVS